MTDPHAVLGLSPGAPADVVQRAFKNAVRRHHPDVNPGDPSAPARLRAIIAAYEALSRRVRTPATVGHAAVGCQLRGYNLFGNVELDSLGAVPGTWLSLELRAMDACPPCSGTGFETVAGGWGRTLRVECDACRGAGLLRFERKVRVRVPYGPKNVMVRLKGMGLCSAGHRGDALLRLR